MVSHAQSSEVADVFAESQLTVDLHIVQRLETVVLIDQPGVSLFEFGAILGGPPIAQVTAAIVLAAFVVKPMTQFMPNDRPDSAIVHRIVGSHVEERWLQNRCRK